MERVHYKNTSLEMAQRCRAEFISAAFTWKSPAQDRACQYSILSPHFSQRDCRQLMAAWKSEVPFFPDGGTDKLVALAPLNNLPPILKQAVLMKLSGPGTFKREGGGTYGKRKVPEGGKEEDREERMEDENSHTHTHTYIVNK